MRMQITVAVLLLMLVQKLTCRGQNTTFTTSSAGVTTSGRCPPISSADAGSGQTNNCNVTTIKATTNLTVPSFTDLNATVKPNTTVKELSLNCSADNWDFRGGPRNNTVQPTLIIPNVSSLRVGEYVCTAKPFNETQTISVVLTLNSPPIILNTSQCIQLDEKLECTCISEGLPLPHIVWPDYKSYQHNVHSNRFTTQSILTLHGPNLQKFPASVECVSENDGPYRDQKTLTIRNKKEPKGDAVGLKIDLRTILAFFIGAASTAVIVCVVLCLVCMCNRCRALTATDGKSNYTGIKLEAVQIQHSQADADQIGENEQTPLRGRRSKEATAAGSSRIEEDTPGEDRNEAEDQAAGEEQTKELDYACIDYSLLQGRGTETQMPKSEDTEYAEIQIKKKPEGQEEELLQDGMDQNDSKLEEHEGEVEVEVEA